MKTPVNGTMTPIVLEENGAVQAMKLYSVMDDVMIVDHDMMTLLCLS